MTSADIPNKPEDSGDDKFFSNKFTSDLKDATKTGLVLGTKTAFFVAPIALVYFGARALFKQS